MLQGSSNKLKFLLKDVNSINEFLLKGSSWREVNSKKHTNHWRYMRFVYTNKNGAIVKLRTHMLDICTDTREIRIYLE